MKLSTLIRHKTELEHKIAEIKAENRMKLLKKGLKELEKFKFGEKIKPSPGINELFRTQQISQQLLDLNPFEIVRKDGKIVAIKKKEVKK